MSQRNSLKPSCDCAIDRALHHDENYIFITGAQKQSDSPSSKSYIAYHIRIGVIINIVVVKKKKKPYINWSGIFY